MTDVLPPSLMVLNDWADDLEGGPVALYRQEVLLPVEGRGAVIFPPTYAAEQGSKDQKSRYSLDELPDGTQVAQIDSVASQANRMEALFKRPPLDKLVPQGTIEVTISRKTARGEDDVSMCVSILDVGHRLGDALVRYSAAAEQVTAALLAFQESGNAIPIAKLAPTSLVFGAWDSRESAVRLPRLIQAVIRAWDVTPLTRGIGYVPAVDYTNDKLLGKTEGKEDLSALGFRNISKTGELGGVVVHGEIRREVTINLVALRALQGTDNDEGAKLRHYVFGLALAAATARQDHFLRQGCLLTPDPDRPATWMVVKRDGARVPVALDFDSALHYAEGAAKDFGVGPQWSFAFLPERAREAVDKKKSAKKNENGTEEEAGGH